MTKYKKNIAIDARFMLRPLRGIPLYVTRLCQYLPELNRDYLFYIFINKGFEHNDNPSNYQHRLDELIENNNNVKVINCDSDAEIMWEQVCLPKLIIKHKIDLLHMPANRTCFLPFVPMIVTLHDVMEYLSLKKKLICLYKNTKFRTGFYSLRKIIYAWAIYRLGIKKARRVVTVSNYSANDIVKYINIPSQNVSVIHHGLDNDFIMMKTTDLDIGTDVEFRLRNHVLMLGGDSHNKNPTGAIAAWSKVPENLRKKFPLKILGFCGSEGSPLVQALRENNIVNEVEIHGWVTQSELIENMRTAALFLYLSRYEGFGFPLLHAMSSGTPLITTNRSSIPEVVGDVGFQFDPDNHVGIAKGIQHFLTKPDLWKKQSIIGIKRSQEFCWRKSAKKHLEVYDSIFGNEKFQ
jgi:glycosyltransferase involved in cell wall biosynthesis